MPRSQQPKTTTNNQGIRSRRKFLNIAGGTAVVTAAGLALGGGKSVRAEAPTEASQDLDASSGETKKKPDFKQYVTQRLEELTAITALDGPIYSELVKVRTALNAVSARLEECGNAVGDPNQIKAINETLCEIKRALGIPCP